MIFQKLPAISFVAIRHFANEVETAFAAHFIVPEVIDTSPKVALDVFYGGKKVIGQCLTPAETIPEPKVAWCNAKPKNFYTLCMVDPDMPSREKPKDRNFNHWLVTNIPGQSIPEGDAIVEYLGPIPKKDTGGHRYILLLYEQPCKTKFKEEKICSNTIRGRERFNVRVFADRYKLCQPIGGMVYVSDWDKSVDATLKKLNPKPKSKKKKRAKCKKFEDCSSKKC